MTWAYNPDLDILALNIYAKNQVRLSVRSPARVVTASQTHDAKTIGRLCWIGSFVWYLYLIIQNIFLFTQTWNWLTVINFNHHGLWSLSNWSRLICSSGEKWSTMEYCKSTIFGHYKIWGIYYSWVIIEAFPYIILFDFCSNAKSAKFNSMPNFVDLQYSEHALTFERIL